MTSITITLISLAFSSIFLQRLVQLNPKRRRSYRLSTISQDSERSRLLWILVFCPALVLLLGKLLSAFIMWLAGLCLIGWIMAMVKPKTDTLTEE